MSSKSPEKKFVKIEVAEEDNFDIRLIVIPFSRFFPKEEHLIYDGSEKIPFSKRDPLFKTILLQEFGDSRQNDYKDY
ncbi:MAG: hypothetical protein ACXAAH_10865 [Promethearchaeota archaeon]|jgi:hypothetical protein